MKKIITAILLICITQTSRAQAQNEQMPKDTNMVEQYAEMATSQMGLGRRRNILIDYGIYHRSSDKKTYQKIYNASTGDQEKIYSDIDALNYMGANGWKLVSSYSTPTKDGIIYSYLFKKSVPKSSVDSLYTKEYTMNRSQNN